MPEFRDAELDELLELERTLERSKAILRLPKQPRIGIDVPDDLPIGRAELRTLVEAATWRAGYIQGKRGK